MKKTLYIFIIAIIVLSACAPQKIDSVNKSGGAETPEVEDEIQTEITVTDALGREVVLDEYPETIVVAGKLRPMIVDFLYLFESSAEKIVAIEAGGQSSENFLKVIDENIESKYSLEKGAGAEQIAPLEPDLVILKSSVKESLGDQLELINIPVVYIDFETVDQIYRDIRILGSVLGENERAEDIITEYQTLYAEFKGYAGQANEEKSTVLMQISNSDQEFAYEIPSVSYLQSVMVADAGGKILWDEAAQAGGWNEINIEQLNVWDPNYIFVINYKGLGQKIIADLKETQPY